jgi:alkylhydroperoxidase family enzyme
MKIVAHSRAAETAVTPPRIEPLAAPYSTETQALFDLAMPEGMEPLLLFRTLATSSRIFPRFMRAGVLDRGPLAIRDRELVIHRTTARCGAAYEWGVHAAAFARPLELGDAWIRATVEASADDPIWEPQQAALVRMCDELHDDASISDATWSDLREHFDEPQILELIYTAGLYHAVSFLCNGLRLPPEPFAEPWPGA